MDEVLVTEGGFRRGYEVTVKNENTRKVRDGGVKLWGTNIGQTNTQMEGLRKTQRAMERSLLNVKRSDIIRSRSVREQVRTRDIKYIIKQVKT